MGSGSACTGQVIDAQFTGGDAFTISGEVASSVGTTDHEIFGAILWIAAVDGTLTGWWTHENIDVRIFSYTMHIPPPPATPFDQRTPTPEGWEGLAHTNVLFGIPVLDDNSEGELPVPDVDAAMAWLLDPSAPSPAPSVYAISRDHLIIATRTNNDDRLASDWSWTDGPCIMNDVQPGMSLYHRDGTHCAGWRPLGPPEYVQYQGVTVVSPL